MLSLCLRNPMGRGLLGVLLRSWERGSCIFEAFFLRTTGTHIRGIRFRSIQTGLYQTFSFRNGNKRLKFRGSEGVNMPCFGGNKKKRLSPS